MLRSESHRRIIARVARFLTRPPPRTIYQSQTFRSLFLHRRGVRRPPCSDARVCAPPPPPPPPRAGAYAIPGVQRKLNFLLHGPPGTGKSKFVRTLSMYLGRHVVSFALTQVESEAQLITLLDNLKCITDDPKKPAWDLCYEDVIFVIEELDTDPRGICLQRADDETGAAAAGGGGGDDHDRDRDDGDESDGSREPPHRGGKGGKGGKGGGKRKGGGKGGGGKSFGGGGGGDEPSEPPLSLGVILRQVCGSSGGVVFFHLSHSGPRNMTCDVDQRIVSRHNHSAAGNGERYVARRSCQETNSPVIQPRA